MKVRNKKKTDNRMEWVRNFEEIAESKTETIYSTEYELFSEVKIPGILEYMNGLLMGGIILGDESIENPYNYAIQIKHNQESFEYNEAKYTEDGYYFHGGIIGELIAIFSVYFGVRFYLKTTIIGELSTTSVKSRYEHNPIYRKPQVFLNREMLTNKDLNWAKDDGLKNFLDLIKELPEDKHQSFILACYWYGQAIKDIGIDRNLFYVKMVSCIESLLEPLRDENDKTEDKFNNLFKETYFSKDEMTDIKGWLKNRKISKRFINFIEKYSVDYTWKEKTPEHCFIRKEDMKEYLARIYKARSAYLHKGKPMYISDDIDADWDISPTGDIMVDQRKILEKEKLPRMRWFEQITRHCLLKYIQDKVTPR